MEIFMWSFAPKAGAKLHRRGKPTIILTLEIFTLNCTGEKTRKLRQAGVRMSLLIAPRRERVSALCGRR